MRIVVAPDSFKESMTAATAAAAMADGVRAVLPHAECILTPLADGGEGTTEALLAALGGQWQDATVRDPLGRPVAARYGITDDGTAIIEAAEAIGLGRLSPRERNPMRATSLGLADLIRDALDHGATRLLIGLGGTATIDGGAGLLAGLGARWLDRDGHQLEPRPDHLGAAHRVDLTGLDPRLPSTAIDLACDVTNPLLGEEGAAAVYGPQKGATPEQVILLDATLERIADALVHAGRPEARHLAGAGAAGGLGAALLALGAIPRPGIDVVAEAVGLERAIAEADLVLTGEGSIDAQTLRGKTLAGVARIAAAAGVPVIALAGRIQPDADALLDAGLAAIVPICPAPVSLEAALKSGQDNLGSATATALRLWLLGLQRRTRHDKAALD